MLDSHICKIDDEKFLLHSAHAKDKVLLITGGASVIGKVMALQFAAHRVKVVIEDRSVDGTQCRPSLGQWMEALPENGLARGNLTYVKIFDTSHMAPLDAPHVMHNVILRFMGVDFSQFFEGSAHIPSSIGDNAKPLFTDKIEETSAPISMNSLEQDKAMWEGALFFSSYSPVQVLIVNSSYGIGAEQAQNVAADEQREEESIPHNASMADENGNEGAYRQRKGKERALEPPEQPIFELGDSDEEEMIIIKETGNRLGFYV
ncbi:hypothetical protein IW262DRAFT_1466921 [Armillaria fumosa]|nr:hypothetical protein IW262DRAFT_1466921 [Armillaria fumosa]